MGAQVVDAVVVLYLPLLVHFVHRPQAVFHQEERLLVAIVQGVEGDAKAQGIDTPAPLAHLDVGIAQGLDHVGLAGVARIHVGGGAAGGVVAEGDEIHGVPEDLVIFRPLHQSDPLVTKHPLRIGRIGAPGLHVDEEEVLPIFLEGGPDVGGLAGVGVEVAPRQHAAHLVGRVHFVGDPGRQGAGHQLVVGDLILHLILVLPLLEHQPRPGEGAVQQDVDLVEGEPVLHQAVELLEAGAGVAGEKLHHLAVAPGAVLGHQVHGHIEVAQGHQGLDVVLSALLEHRTVEGDALGIGLALVPPGVETGPGDGGAKHGEAHLGHQGDVLPIAVIEVDGPVAWVELVILQGDALLLAEFDRHAARAMGDHVYRGQPLAPLEIAALRLIGGQGTAPEKALGKSC